MINLLDSTEIATVFLDAELNVRRYTEMATRIIKLIPGDVGRPLTDLSTNLEYGELAVDAQEVLRSLVFCEKRVVAKNGHTCVVWIMPYRTMTNLIDGLVITFIDGTEGGKH
jgi:two-component system, chemotaxis family, CheB/CheR fusion protein